MKQIRCAIYTRKSSEEGLDQAFNSLDAQREACASYIASQKHEGWVLLPQFYDDGGLSGGTLERPALRALMRDVDEGNVDQIVVYKIDRLTRSLADFAKLVERLDVAKASFVSVTQSFNTATSMGRLTLNVLLSFAQFEREVTAERIRDKIAASKKKGLWMGGNVPLGYEADGRTLKINPQEADTIRLLFKLYLQHGSIRGVKEVADEIGLRPKSRIQAFSRGHIHYILSNPVYIGRIRHRSQTHDGQHEGIIGKDIWEKVQTSLVEASARPRGKAGNAVQSSPLVGKLSDETGDRLTPSHANKKGRRYRYYVSNRLVSNSIDNVTGSGSAWRLPALELEDRITDAIVDHLRLKLRKDLLVNGTADEILYAEKILAGMATKNQTISNAILRDCLECATIQPGTINISLDVEKTANLLRVGQDRLTPQGLSFNVSFRFRKRGVETRLVIGDTKPANVDIILVRNLANAHLYYMALKHGKSFDEISEQYEIPKRRLLQILNMAFLAPDIVSSIMNGSQPLGLTSEWLQRKSLPLDWQEQRRIAASI